MNRPNSTAPSEDRGGKKQVYVREAGETCAESVIRAVSELTGTDAEAMDPLFDVIDPDALNALCNGGSNDEQETARRVSFQFHGCDVVVYGDGRTVVSRAGGRNPR